MSPRPVMALAALLVVASVGVTGGSVAAAGTNVAIEDVSVDVADPAPGEVFTVDVTIANLPSSTGPVDVKSVFVRSAGTANEVAEIRAVGTIDPGSSLTLPMSLEFAQPGAKRLTVTAVVVDGDDEVRQVRHPLLVRVEQPDDAALSVSDVAPVAGQASPLNVTVANGVDRPLSNLRLSLRGNASVADAERVTGSLDTGTERTYRYEVTFPAAGTYQLTADLRYRTSSGYTRTITRQVPVTVAPATVDAGLTATVLAPNGTADIRTTLTAFGNVDLRDGEVRIFAGDRRVARSLVPDVPADAERSVVLDGSDVPAGTVTVVAEFAAAGETHRLERELRYAPSPTAGITIAGVDVSRVEDRLTIRGNTTNVGSAAASAVLVSLVEGQGVTPSAPSREAFVGTVGPSQRGQFELTATVSEGVTTVPVRLEYTVDGERYTEERQLAVADAAERTAEISLTGVAFSRQDGVLTISGDAANVGTIDARSVLVSVEGTAGVTPVSPKKEFFVGAVDASEFATFELTANVSADVDTIPVSVAYTVNGDRLTDVVGLALPDRSLLDDEDSGGGGLPLIELAAVLLVLAVLVTVYRRRR